eukprot:TRINITY_DN19737_c0_g1_i1.p1 TRINITY_DN19737_c0_g1~~TRINITY_DN19737_c0_g1_i1.p1  ORF type:complete len:320 (+),score=107.64 TRINITY_DN19737_c0_g1_i1:76-1035(+)
MPGQGALFLDGPQWGCHGPSESLRAARRELRQMGVSETPPVTLAERRAANLQTTKTVPTADIEAEDDGGRIGGEVKVMSMRRELVALVAEEERWQVECVRQEAFVAEVDELEAGRVAEHGALEEAEADAWRGLLKREGLDKLGVEHHVKIRLHSERQALQVENHFIDEAMWAYTESHRELFDAARSRVVAEFDKVETVHANKTARDTMRQEAIGRLFAQDTARFKQERDRLAQLTLQDREAAAAEAAARRAAEEQHSRDHPMGRPKHNASPDFPFASVFQQGLGGRIASPMQQAAGAMAQPPDMGALPAADVDAVEGAA